MPEYVDDPDNLGKKVDVIRLQIRRPYDLLRPYWIEHWLLRDVWTRRQALLLLAGYDADRTNWGDDGRRFNQIPIGQIWYLDKTSAHQLHDAGITHPRHSECFEDFWKLCTLASGTPLDETRTPDEWIAWAGSKKFQPYWIAAAKAYVDKCCIASEVDSTGDTVPDATKPEKGMTHTEPNWSLWHRMLKASLFDAVCLTCNVNPGAATLNPVQHGIAHLLGLDFVGLDVTREIAERLSIARSHAGTGGTLPTLTGDKDGEVYLAMFAEWAVDTMNWTVPDEFRALASTAQSVAAVADVPVRTVTRKLASRRHALSHIIEKAKQSSIEPDSYLSVWPEIVRLAESETPPAPLMGFVKGKGGGVRYRTDGGSEIFTKDALRKQMNPSAR